MIEPTSNYELVLIILQKRKRRKNLPTRTWEVSLLASEVKTFTVYTLYHKVGGGPWTTFHCRAPLLFYSTSPVFSISVPLSNSFETEWMRDSGMPVAVWWWFRSLQPDWLNAFAHSNFLQVTDDLLCHVTQPQLAAGTVKLLRLVSGAATGACA